jgi:hypothetical protein
VLLSKPSTDQSHKIDFCYNTKSDTIKSEIIEKVIDKNYDRGTKVEFLNEFKDFTVTSVMINKLYSCFKNKGFVIPFDVAKSVNPGLYGTEEEYYQEHEYGSDKIYAIDHLKYKGADIFVFGYDCCGQCIQIRTLKFGKWINQLELKVSDEGCGGWAIQMETESGEYSIDQKNGIVNISNIYKTYICPATDIAPVNPVTFSMETKINRRFKINDVGIFFFIEGKEEKYEYWEPDEIEELNSRSSADLRKMRNHIYAKYGYKFKSADLQKYFSEFDWYEPEYDNVDAKLTYMEQRLIYYILNLEKSK